MPVSDFYLDWLDYSDNGGHMPYADWRAGFLRYCRLSAEAAVWGWENGWPPVADAPQYDKMCALAVELRLKH